MEFIMMVDNNFYKERIEYIKRDVVKRRSTFRK